MPNISLLFFSRVHTIGICPDHTPSIVTDLAVAGKGTAQYIHDSSTGISTKVIPNLPFTFAMQASLEASPHARVIHLLDFIGCLVFYWPSYSRHGKCRNTHLYFLFKFYGGIIYILQKHGKWPEIYYYMIFFLKRKTQHRDFSWTGGRISISKKRLTS